MKKSLLISVISLFLVNIAHSLNLEKFPKDRKKIVVAVIDTGLASELMNRDSICESGHKDFTGTGLKDNHGHGTHISGLIDQYVKDSYLSPYKDNLSIDKIKENYCQIIIKYYDPNSPKTDSLINTVNSFKWAIAHKVDIINYSGGGIEFSEEEYAVVTEALNKGIKIVASAGNNGANLSKNPCNDSNFTEQNKLCRYVKNHDIKYGTFYPAMYDERIYVVGNLLNLNNKEIANSSNYGHPVTFWEVGTNSLSTLPNNSIGYMSGTSQAAAIKTGKIIREILHKN